MSKKILSRKNGKAPAARSNDGVDERVRRSRASVLRITSELLKESGLGGFSVDEVSRRSGVAKTTIYRHWPMRTDLIIDACSQISTTHEAPDTGSFEGDVTALLTNTAELLRTANWSSVMPSIIDEAERNPRIAEVHSRIQMGHTAPFQQIIKRAIVKGELPKGTNVAAVIASLLGPLFYRRWFSREPLDGPFVKGVVRSMRRSLT
jgi:AcrR family transcriptional regulator